MNNAIFEDVCFSLRELKSFFLRSLCFWACLIKGGSLYCKKSSIHSLAHFPRLVGFFVFEPFLVVAFGPLCILLVYLQGCSGFFGLIYKLSFTDQKKKNLIYV